MKAVCFWSKGEVRVVEHRIQGAQAGPSEAGRGLGPVRQLGRPALHPAQTP